MLVKLTILNNWQLVRKKGLVGWQKKSNDSLTISFILNIIYEYIPKLLILGSIKGGHI